MSTSTADLLAASERLDPPNRALMNLWLRRQLDDVAIARLSGGTPEEIAERRERLLEALAQEVDVPAAEVRAALAELKGSPQDPVAVERESAAGAVLLETAAAASPAPPAPAPPEPAPPPAPGALRGPEPSHPPSAPELAAGTERPAGPPQATPLPSSLIVALGVCLAVMIALATLTGGGDPAPERADPGGPAAAGRPGSPPPPVQPPAGGSAGGSGTLTVEGERMVVSVAGLQGPASDYVVWLFNSQSDAEPVGRLDELSFPIPRGVERFEFVDVSLETDDDPGHSGRSVARMPAPSAGG